MCPLAIFLGFFDPTLPRFPSNDDCSLLDPPIPAMTRKEGLTKEKEDEDPPENGRTKGRDGQE